ncbi:MAG: transcriptional regulator, partial [Dermabacter sp.]|nr:transcriptional regulator [Dermabacter sp.]
SAPGIEVHAQLRLTRLDLARRILRGRIIRIDGSEDEWTHIVVHYPDVESVRQLLQFGDHIRILRPAATVVRFRDIAAQIVQFHSAQSTADHRRSDR